MMTEMNAITKEPISVVPQKLITCISSDLHDSRSFIFHRMMLEIIIWRASGIMPMINQSVKNAYPAFKRMLMADGADQIKRIAHDVHYEFEMQEKPVTIGGMSFSSIDIKSCQ